MEKKQFLWDFCLEWGANSELLATKRDEKRQKVFFYTNLASKMRLMENLGWIKHNKNNDLDSRALTKIRGNDGAERFLFLVEMMNFVFLKASLSFIFNGNFELFTFLKHSKMFSPKYCV